MDTHIQVVANTQEKEWSVELLSLCRSAKAKATLDAVTAYDDNYTVAALSFSGYSTSLSDTFKTDETMAEATGKVAAAKNALTVCNLLQNMYKKYPDESVRSSAVKTALGKVPKSGTYAIHKRVFGLANAMVQ